MKHTGRFMSVLIVVGFFSFWATYRTIIHGSYFEDVEKIPFISVVLAVNLVMGWFIGKQFDKTKYFAKLLEMNEKELTDRYEELHESKQELQQIFEISDSILFIRDVKNKSMQVSAGLERLTGYSKEQFLKDDRIWTLYVLPEDLHIVIEMEKQLLSGHPNKCSFRIQTNSGQIRWLYISAVPMVDSTDQVYKIHGVGTDITQLKEKQEQLQHMAYHDTLTGLPNRIMITDYLNREIDHCKLQKKKLAAMYIDLDRFKEVNDSMGHHSGDQLLKEVADRLKICVRDKDVIARHGGDEFIMIVIDTNTEEMVQLSQNILREFSAPFQLNNQELYITPSMGISMFPEDGHSGEELLRHADKAMYMVKEHGKNNFHFHSEGQKTNSNSY